MGTKSIPLLFLKRYKQTQRWTTGQWGQTRLLFCPSEWQPPTSAYNDMKGENIFKSKEYTYSSVLIHQRKKKMQEKTLDGDKRETSVLMYWKIEKGRNIQNNCLTLRFAILLPSLQSVRWWKNRQWEEIFRDKTNKFPATHTPRPENFKVPLSIWVIFITKFESWFNAMLFVRIPPSSFLKIQL